MNIILDTNFVVDAFRFNVDVKSELAGNDLFVLDANMFEIEKIAKRKTKEAALARMALDFVRGNDIKVLKSIERETDDSLISYSKEGYAIATHDRALKAKLKKTGAKVVFIRQRKYVVIQ